MIPLYLNREDEELVVLLRRNVDLFFWTFVDMPRIHVRMVCHRFSVESIVKLVSLRKDIMGGKKRSVIDEEVEKLKYFINEVKYMT